ncbi:hypothetical protein [Streptomyces sp. NPDC007088]|uniref:hypothetical protein n=1 Tax=Streptomyces sp. NPDC007088 TaxID=3364773 RepID=UPI0036D0BF40
MPVTDATFYPLIITDRPTDSLYQQPPTGTDMSAARLVPITDVHPGDWVLGSYEAPLTPGRLGTLMQSVSSFPALPATLNGYVALDGKSDVWHDEGTVLIIPRAHIPGDTYGDRSGGYRLGDRVERTFIHEPTHDSARDTAGVRRPVIQRGTVIAVEGDAFTVEWSGRWPGSVEEQAMRLADPAEIARERSVYGFAIGDTLSDPRSTVVGVVLELFFHSWWMWDGAPSARVYWPGNGWANTHTYTYHPTHRFEHAIPNSEHEIRSREQYPAP